MTSRLGRRFHIVALILAIGLFVAAEVMRNSHVRDATLLSMVAWSLFLVAFLQWAWLGSGRRSALADLTRIAILTAVAGTILRLYFVRSGSIDAGVHVDAAYSYIGAAWFAGLRSPITFAAPNPSYPQLPLMVLAHLPAFAIGFGRLGAFACLFGTMLQVAILLAVMTTVFVRGRMIVQVLIAALAAAVFSNRLLVLSYNNFGYTVPAICLGFMFIAVVDDESVPDPDRIVGGLLSVALLHHYSGITQVLPLTLLWLLLRKRSLHPLPSFVAKNPILLGVGAMFVITLVIHPQLFMRRLGDVTMGVGHGAAAPFFSHDFVPKLRKNWAYLVSAYWRDYPRQLFRQNGGSWPFLSIPPLGGWIGPLVAGMWVASCWVLPGRRGRYLLYFVSSVAGLLVLLVLQHVVADFADYRDLTPLFALVVAGLLFVFRVASVGRTLRLAAISYAVGVALFNYADVANLRGKVHNSFDFAYLSQQTMEDLLAFLKQRKPENADVARIDIVLDSYFPLQSLYMTELAGYGVPVRVIAAKEYCAAPARVLEAASAMGCGGFLFVAHGKHCPERLAADGPSPSRVTGHLYRSICGHPEAGLRDRSVVTIGIGPDGPATP